MSHIFDVFCATCGGTRDGLAIFISADPSQDSLKQHPVRDKQDTGGPTVRERKPLPPEAYSSPVDSPLSEPQVTVLEARYESGDQLLGKGNTGREESLRTRNTQNRKEQSKKGRRKVGNPKSIRISTAPIFCYPN